jgi:threonine dehydrogenase-like Zn-dependent dehydrogenase
VKAVAVTPGAPGSAHLIDVDRPPDPAGGVLVETIAVGVCGTDREIIAGDHGSAPEGETDLIIGHEVLGRVLEAPKGSGLVPGDHVAGIVRRPDPVPCSCCARGRWDMCTNGLFTERGIKGLHGYACERFTIEPEYCVKVDPSLGLAGVLTEPASIIAKAWRRLDAAEVACDPPRTVLVAGAGPIGLLAAAAGIQRGLEVHVLDRVDSGPKPELAAALGATYHSGTVTDALPHPDVTLECTGAPALIFDVLCNAGPNGIVCLTGVSAAGHKVQADPGALNRDLVLENNTVIGTVNANASDYAEAAKILGRCDLAWLEALITRRVPLERWSDAYEPGDDIKVVLEFAAL